LASKTSVLPLDDPALVKHGDYTTKIYVLVGRKTDIIVIDEAPKKKNKTSGKR